MNISYFSESLAHYLGYIQEDIIDQDISVLLPQELFNAHSKAVLRHLISKQKRIFNHIHCFMFDKSRMGINSFLKGSTLPGLGKYLLIITSIELEEKKNIYHLYYTENFQLISMSMNFMQNFLLDFNLVRKYDIDLLYLFSLNENNLRKLVLKEKPQIDNIKNDISMLTEEYFVNKLFSANNRNNRKFQLLDDLEKNYSEGSSGIKFRKIITNAKRKMELIHNNKMNTKIKFQTLIIKKKKNEIVENYNKFLHEKINVDYTDKSFKALLDSFYKFKQFNNVNNETSGFNEKICENIFEIKIYLRILYDTPFVMFVIEELMKVNEKKQPVIFANNFNKDLLMTKATIRKKTNVTCSITNESTVNSTISSINLNKTSQYNNKRKKYCCVKYIFLIISILLCLIFTIYITVIAYRIKMLNNSYDIFLALFYDYGQRDSLLRLYSVMISGYFQYLSFVNYTNYFSLDEYNDFIKKTSGDYGESYHQFYKYYTSYSYNLGKELITLYREYNFSKISLDWREIAFYSNFMNEGDNMVHLSTSAVTNPNKEEIKEDLKLYFNANYREYYNTNKKIIVHSNYLVILYYFSKNYNKVYHSLFQDLQNEIQSDYHSYSDESKRAYKTLESFGLVINFVFCGILIFFLLITNKKIFRNILSLFLDYTQPENLYTINNRIDNKILAEKLKQFNYLMENFNLNSLDKYCKVILQDSSILLEEKKAKIPSTNNKIESPLTSNKKIIKMKKSDTNTNKNQNDQSTSMSKTTNKLLPNVGSIVTKLNPKNTNSTGNTKNSLLSESSNSKNIIIKNNLKNIVNTIEDSNDDILTRDKISEKTDFILINKIKINITFLIITLLVIISYFFFKLFISLEQINTMSQLFDDFGHVTRRYSLTYYYFENICLLIINKKLGDESVFDTMTSELQKESTNSNEVKNKRLSNYRKTFEVMSILNKEDKNITNEKFEKTICEQNNFCKMVLNSQYNLFSEGIEIGINAIFQRIQNTFIDYLNVKNDINVMSDITNFIGASYQRIDMNLNFVINLIEERINEAFLEDVNDLKKSADRNVIIYNIVLIAFLAIMALIVISLIVSKIISLDKMIEESTLRLNKAFCFIKLKNMGLSMQTSSLVY